MSALTTQAFWVATGERAIKTAAQSLIAVGLSNATGIFDVDWLGALSAAGLATLLSVLTSIVSSGIGDTSGPSLGGGEVLSSKAIPAEVVDALADPDSPSGSVAGPASPLPDETPVDVVPVDPHIAVQDSDRGLPSDPLDAPSQDYDGYGAPISDKP